MMDALQTATQLADIGKMLEQIGDYECALEQYQQCLRIQKHELASESLDQPEIADTLQKIGILYSKLGEYDEAIVQLQKSYGIYKTLYGRDHTQTQQCLKCVERVMELALAERQLSHTMKKREQQQQQIRQQQKLRMRSSYQKNSGGYHSSHKNSNDSVVSAAAAEAAARRHRSRSPVRPPTLPMSRNTNHNVW